MKSFKQYIAEAEADDKNIKRRANIKFTIWEAPDKKIAWLSNNDNYQKIEYKYEDSDKNIKIDFLLGFDKNAKSWKLWIGKIGGVNYDDDPYYDLKVNNFADAIIIALDKVEEFIEQVEDDQHKWIQYYNNI